MTTDQLLSLVQQLAAGRNPLTGRADPRLGDPETHQLIGRLAARLAPGETPAGPSDQELLAACAELTALGYQPTPGQLLKFLTGSRSVVDDRLRAQPSFRRYRGVVPRTRLRQTIADFRSRHPEPFAAVAEGRRRPTAPWRSVDFFTATAFDRLDDGKEAELSARIAELALRRQSTQLPAFMARARLRYARAFEPWTDAERALLIEAMCYTNAVDRLAALFGRSPKSVSGEGQRLIYRSQRNATSEG